MLPMKGVTQWSSTSSVTSSNPSKCLSWSILTLTGIDYIYLVLATSGFFGTHVQCINLQWSNVYAPFLGVYYIIRKVLFIIKSGFMRYLSKFKIDFYALVWYIFFSLGFFISPLSCYNNSCKNISNYFLFVSKSAFLTLPIWILTQKWQK